MQKRDYGTALITGGGSGIGKATAIKLASKGAAIAVSDLKHDAAEAVAAEIVSTGGRAMALGIDVTDAQSISTGFADAEAELGGVDVLVNSAGLLLVTPFLELSLESWMKVMAVNVTGTFLCCQRAAKSMVERKYGRIINISSISGMRAGIGRMAYGTSKAAIIGLTRQLALELGPFNVTANTIAPGVIETPMTADAYTNETWDRVLSMIPAGRRGKPEDISEAIAYLASPESSYVNGEILTVDGGYMSSGMTQTGHMSASASVDSASR